ncbi:MAG: hypothetical protein HYZ09_01880 [Candidatus Kerfeldbacteria bacterium]|nr:hypothetical protein [Candidatus Kerfeldbacteria bacterium]
MIAHVVPALALPRSMGIFDYTVPAGVTVAPGDRVRIPFRRRVVLGVVWDVRPSSSIDPRRLRPLLAETPRAPVFSPSHRSYFSWIAERYAVSLGLIVKTALAFSAPLNLQQKIANPQPPRTDIPLQPGQLTLVTFDRYRQRDAILSTLATASGKRSIALVVPERNRLNALATMFPHAVVVHSGLTARQRAATVNGLPTARVIIGTRLLLLTPLPDLGLIVLDDEENEQHKQRDLQPRFTSQALATTWIRQQQIPLLALSPAPTLATFHTARTHRGYVHQPARKPTVQLVVPAQTRKQTALEHTLVTFLENARRDHARTFVFLNRRGLARRVQCPDCGWIARCPDCGTALTQHAEALRCPTCGFTGAAPTHCPDCGSATLRASVPGTAGLERIIARRFPGHVSRLDRDVDQAPAAPILIGTERALSRLASFAPQRAIVLGTDALFSQPSARAVERGFQLLRRIAATDTLESMLIETRAPRHELFQRFASGAVELFLAGEWERRRELGLAPAAPAVVFEQRRTTDSALPALRAWLTAAGLHPDELRGPLEAYIGRRKVLRYQLTGEGAHRIPPTALTALPESWIIDPDPVG